jgi:hypothetical protein
VVVVDVPTVVTVANFVDVDVDIDEAVDAIVARLRLNVGRS